MERGSVKIILALGGVATNDAGAGMARALGYRFLDKRGREIPEGVRGFKFLHRIDETFARPGIKKIKFLAVSDVRNPLCGQRGSAVVYGPQKGATPAMVKEIDSLLKHFSVIVERDLKIRVADMPGAGAAGGAGAGAVAFLGAELKKGIDTVLEAVEFEKKSRDADLIITGEGKIDRQTAYGKTLSGVAKAAKKYGIPAIAFCGEIGEGAETARSLGIDAIFSILRAPVTREESIRNAGTLLEMACEEAMRLLKIRSNPGSPFGLKYVKIQR
jgi:glycerate kinase